MARNYKRDSKGRFSSAGGGGKLGKSAKNEKARAKYKKSKENLKATNEVYGGNSPAAKSKGAKRAIGAAKSGMTRTTKGLQGGASRQGSFKDLGKGKAAAPAKSAPKAARPPKGGNTRSTSTKPAMKPQDKARAASASASRKVKASQGAKAKASATRASDLKGESGRMDRALAKQRAATKASPTAQNKARLKTIESEARMAKSSAKKAARAASKADRRLKSDLAKASGKKKGPLARLFGR